MNTPPRGNDEEGQKEQGQNEPPPIRRRRRRLRRRPRRRRDDDESKEGDDQDETKVHRDPRTFLGKLGDADVESRRTNPDQEGNDKGPQALVVTPSLLLF
mgnify:CR=1 FL=1